MAWLRLTKKYPSAMPSVPMDAVAFSTRKGLRGERALIVWIGSQLMMHWVDSKVTLRRQKISVNVEMGEGPDLGKVRFEIDPKGHFTCAVTSAGNGRIYMPRNLPEGIDCSVEVNLLRGTHEILRDNSGGTRWLYATLPSSVVKKPKKVA